MRRLKKIFEYVYTIPMILFFVIIGILSWENLKGYVNDTIKTLQIDSLEEFTNTFEDNLADNFSEKNVFVNLNGWMTNVLGINTLNDCQKFANGQIGSFVEDIDVTPYSDAIIELSDFLQKEDIGFVFVQAVEKARFYDVPFAPGYETNGSEAITEMESKLTEAGVNFVSMQQYFMTNELSMEEVYFKTDHHWLPKIAFVATKQIMLNLSENYDIIYDDNSLDLNNWNEEVYKDWFLGSSGKRVGEYYAGVDDLTYIYPEYDVDITFSALPRDKNTWIYRDTVYNTEYLDRVDYFGDNPYCLYIGGDYPLVNIRNTKAINDKKAIIIGDSYRLPVDCFLSTQFTELYHIDTRYYSVGSVAEYIAEISPDVVIMLVDDFSNEKYALGVNEYEENYMNIGESKIIYQKKKLEITATDSSSYYAMVYEDLKPGSYIMTFGDASISENAGLYIQVSLFDFTTGEYVNTRYLIADYGEEQQWLFTVPESIDDYKVIVYAGMKGQTEGVKVDINNISLGEF